MAWIIIQDEQDVLEGVWFFEGCWLTMTKGYDDPSWPVRAVPFTRASQPPSQAPLQQLHQRKSLHSW